MTPGYTPDICPFYTTADVPGFIAFCKKWFNGQVLHTLPDTISGLPKYAEIRIGNGLVMVSRMQGQLPPGHNHTMVRVANCTALYEQAVAAGVRSVQAPVTVQHSGEVYAGIADPDGNTWWLSTVTEQLSYEEQLARYQQKTQY